MFKCKTKGNVSPQGKRRVYFTCHPDDYDRFFEKISSEILKFSDCAIWYNPDDNYEDIDTDLGQMNLFVIPITTKLLTKPCRTMELDVPFALEKHIPILPLMQEDSLDELFTHHFGDLQYLNPNAHDITAISYEDKLKKYLNSVLVSDEMAEKVRAAFDAYIFLSYRKKDRKYANELMRLIHQNDFCRDIAIWYDEYLVPGEDFNNAITKALKKSDIFTMVVTPNLVNETNYVQTKEYPAAVQQNKTIIPTELEKTDYKALSEKYPKIPNCVDAHDKIALSDVLHSSLLQIAKRENNNDPQHNFFIGLAYLEGIDVEVNHERALQLITSAAETNEVPEAIEKLVTMYQDGYGVERDYRVAVEWQQRLVDYWEKEYRKKKEFGNYLCLFDELLALGDKYLELKNIDAAEFSYARMLTLCEEWTKNLPPLPKLDKTISRWDRSLERIRNPNSYDRGTFFLSTLHEKFPICYDKLGMIYVERRELDRAYEFFNKSVDIKDQLAYHNGYLDTQNAIATSYDKLGALFKLHNNLDKAEKYYRKSFNWRKFKADRNLININGWLELLYSYINLGDIYYEQYNLDEAEDYYCNAFEICMNLVAQDNTWSTYNNLATNYEKLGNIYHEKGNLTEAEQCYCDALSIRKDFMNQYESLSDYRNIANTYDILGDIYNEYNEFDKAEDFYNNALSIRKELLKKYGICDLSFSYDRFGNLYLQSCKFKKSEDYYQKSLLLLKQQTEKTDTVQNQYNLSNIYFNLGNLYKMRMREIVYKMVNGEYKFGDFYKVWYNFNITKKFYKKALVLIKQLSEKTGLLKYKYRLAEIYNELGYIYMISFFWKKAKNNHQKAYILIKSLVKEKGTVRFQIKLLDCYTKLDFIFTKLRKLDKAKKYKQRAINLIEQLVNKTGISNVEFATYYAMSYYSIAISNKPYDRDQLMKSLDIWLNLAVQYPKNYYFSTQRDFIKRILEQME